MTDFYDQLAPLYHLIYADWNASVRRQGEQLGALIEGQWPGHRRVLDVACGIGTQSIALASMGYTVTGSDLSEGAIQRARQEAHRWGVSIPFSVCDMLQAHAKHGSGYDVVICCDNSLPHLLNDRAILSALGEMRNCLAIGGGCLVSVRDYEREERGRHLFKPHGVRTEGDKRYTVFQIWDFEGEHYDLTMVFLEEHLPSHEVKTHMMRSRYYAVTTDRLCELMRQSGFCDVRRLDDRFHQPMLVGTRAACLP